MRVGTGGVATYSRPYTFRHVATGRYLCAGRAGLDMGGLSLCASAAEPAALFFLRPAAARAAAGGGDGEASGGGVGSAGGGGDGFEMGAAEAISAIGPRSALMLMAANGQRVRCVAADGAVDEVGAVLALARAAAEATHKAAGLGGLTGAAGAVFDELADATDSLLGDKDLKTLHRLKGHDALAAGTKENLCLLRGADWPGEGGADVVVEKPVKGDDGAPCDARTVFRRLASQEEPRCTLCIAAPATGRPHQIRRHAQHLSMPIIGDSKHGDSRVNRWWREERGLDRLALHCLAISLDDVDGEAVSLLAPLEGELARALRGEPLWATAAARDPRLDAPPVDVRTGSHGSWDDKVA